MAAFRMALWAALILLDSRRLTDSDTSINGESLAQQYRTVGTRPSAPCQRTQGPQRSEFDELGLFSNDTAATALHAIGLGLHAVLLFLLGIDVRWHNEELIPAQRHVLVSNHVTTGDLMMLYKRPQRYVHLVAPGLPQRVTEVLLYTVFLHAQLIPRLLWIETGSRNHVSA